MLRRGNNEGSIYKDKQGRWRGVVSMPSADGKSKRKYIYGKSRKEVSEKMNELLSQLGTNTYIEPNKTTLYDWLCLWLETYCKNEIRMSSFVNYRTYVLKHIKDSIGMCELYKLTPVIIQNFYNTKFKNGRLDGKGGLSPKTIKNMHDMLHKALAQAVKLDMIAKNPADAVVLPKRKKVEMRYFTVEEQKQLQEALKGHRLEMPILLALYTGVRQGELLGLPWKNVYLDLNGQSYIRITQTLNRVMNPDENAPNKTILQINEPKTIHSVRTIPLLPEIAEKLSRYREAQAAYFKSHHLPASDFVFTSTTGTPIEPRDFQRDFKKILKQNGIRIVHIHGLRHTFATRSIQSGMNIKALSAILGHSNVGFTLSTYAHVTESLKAEEISNLKDFL